MSSDDKIGKLDTKLAEHLPPEWRGRLALVEAVLKLLSGPVLAVALVVFGALEWHTTGKEVRDLMVKVQKTLDDNNAFMTQQKGLIEALRLELQRR